VLEVDLTDFVDVDTDSWQDLSQGHDDMLRLHRVGQHLWHETMPELDVVAADKGYVEPFAPTLALDELAGGSDAGVTAAQDQDIVREVVDCHWLPPWK